MKYLIDTHVLIWFMMNPEKISKSVMKIITNEENRIFLSSISFWEMAIKSRAKKLDLGGVNILHLPHIAEQYDFEVLSPEPYDYVSVGTVPQKENHHDPFDRMLIQQAIRNNLVLLSSDSKFQQYEENGLQLMW